MNAVDSNILVYSHDPRDLGKQKIACSLVKELENGVLLWQVACEYASASRKLVAFGISYEKVRDHIRKLKRLWGFAGPNWQVFESGGELKQRHGFSHWDSLIVAHCLHIGVKRL